jgi:hypothetical protein
VSFGVFNQLNKGVIMLMKYNDGETTFILSFNGKINVDDIDYMNDINQGDKTAAIYMKDGESIVLCDVIAEETSTEEPNMMELA